MSAKSRGTALTCQRKRRFPSRTVAKLQAANMGMANTLRAYMCTYCYSYHLGHPMPGDDPNS